MTKPELWSKRKKKIKIHSFIHDHGNCDTYMAILKLGKLAS